MPVPSSFRRFPYLLLLSGASLAFGFLVPVIYELMRPRASRHRHYGLEQLAVATILFTAIVCTSVTWIRRHRIIEPEPNPHQRRFQFEVRHVLIATTLIAVVFAMTRFLDAPAASGMSLSMLAAIAAWAIPRGRQLQFRIAGLMGMMFFPFVWVFAFNRPIGTSSGLIAAVAVGPGILASVITAMITHMSMGNTLGIAGTCASVQLLVGAWLASRGGKWFTLYALVSLITSTLGSLALHLLYRM